jgi:non-ribosomal peptide synthetase component F
VRETVLGAYMHQDFPFEMVIEHLFLDREDHRTPLVNILMVMQNVPLSNAALSDLTITPVSTSTTSAKFDLALFVTEDQAGLDCSVNYSTDLFKEATVEQFMYCYITLIRNIVARPEAAIENLEITTQEEKQLQTAHKEKHLRRQLDKLKDHKKKLANLS